MKNNIQKEIVKISEKLISFRSSELYPLEKKACLDFIEQYFKDLKQTIYIKKIINKNCTAIIISNNKGGQPDLLINGHIDVVEGEDILFKPKRTKNKLYGRGAIDMKASVAVMMVLMKQIIQEKVGQKITLMIAGDEEIPGNKSTEYLIKTLKLKPKFAIVGEETGFDIVTEQKGTLNIKARAVGISAHSAFPEKGVNAIEKCLGFYEKIKKLKCFKLRKSYKNTIALTYLSGGQAINSIPDSCEMGINIRFISKKDLTSILDFINKYRKKNKVDLNIETYYSSSLMKSIRCEREIIELKKIIKGVSNIKAKIKKTSTGSDARYFSEKKLPVIMFGPKGENYHEKNEYVEIESLVDYYKILYQFINK